MAKSYLTLSLYLVSSVSAICPGRGIDEPIEFEDGDYLIAAIFHIGEFVTTSPGNQTYPDGFCISDEKKSFWGFQRALAFRRTMQADRARLR